MKKKAACAAVIIIKNCSEMMDSYVDKIPLLLEDRTHSVCLPGIYLVFKMISKNNKSLTDLLSTKNLDSHKIQDLEIFKKKTETMVVSHDIRLNTAIKDINELKFNQSK